MIAGPLVRPDLVFGDLGGAADCQAVLRALAERVVATGWVEGGAERLYRALLEREQLGSTGLGQGVAMPHCKLKGMDEGLLAIGVANPGVDFGAPDGAPVSVFFLVLSPDDSPAQHLQTLARISRWVRTPGNVDTLRAIGAGASTAASGSTAAAGSTGAAAGAGAAVYDYLKESL